MNHLFAFECFLSFMVWFVAGYVAVNTSHKYIPKTSAWGFQQSPKAVALGIGMGLFTLLVVILASLCYCFKRLCERLSS